MISDRKTLQAEAHISAMPAREFVLRAMVRAQDEADGYEVVIVDVSPSICLLQACASIYAGNVIVPVDMDIQAVQGAISVIESNKVLTRVVSELEPIKTLGFLPVKVDARIAMSRAALDAIDKVAQTSEAKVFHGIRTDSSVPKAARESQFLQDYAPKCKAMEDYGIVFDQLLKVLNLEKGDVVTTENVLEASVQ
jgi:chromosome partitioning protein